VRAYLALLAVAFAGCPGNHTTESKSPDAALSIGKADASGCATTACNDASSGGDGSAGSALDGAGGMGPVDASGADTGSPTSKWDWNGVVGTGQSLSVGAQAGTPTLTTQPFHNLKLSLGTASVSVPPYNPNDPALSVVPLIETIRAEATSYPSAYPANIYGETPHTAMGDQISSLYRQATGGDYVSVHTVVGESGQPLSVINKTATVTPTMGHAYAATLFEVAALKRLATMSGKTYGVGGIVLTHGESDAGNTNYESGVYQLLTDYNTDIAAITGQKAKVRLLLTQQQTTPGDNTTTASLIAEWKIGVDHPGEAICVGPKYQYPYASDHLHLVAQGYDQLGEKYGEVYYATIVLGQDWQPLQPAMVTRNGATITVKFHVPVLPLAWDTTMPAPHQTAHTAWAQGKGFEVQNQSGEQTITSVAIQNDSVVITLASPPATAGLVVRYAVTQDGSGSLGGEATGRIGQLRDSDPMVGYATKLPLYDYAVSFELPVN
jgi:hypothetical protein